MVWKTCWCLELYRRDPLLGGTGSYVHGGLLLPVLSTVGAGLPMSEGAMQVH